MQKRLGLILLALLYLAACSNASQSPLGVPGQPTLVFIYTEN